MILTKLRRGFTLIEILIVISIIGVLVAIVIVSVGSSRGKALDSKVKSGAVGLSKALSQFDVDKDQYPIPTPNTVGGVVLGSLNSFLIPDYLSSDSALTSTGTAKYVVTADGKNYAQARLLNYEKETPVTSGSGVYGTAAYGVPGLVAVQMGTVGALSFDGSNDYITVGATPNLNNLTSMTFGAWALTNNNTNTQHFISKSDLTYLRVLVATGALRAQARVRFTDVTSLAVTGTSTIQTGRWNHMVATYDGASRILRLYVNGVQEVQATAAAGKVLGQLVGSNLQFGRLASATGSGYLSGQESDVRIYDRALTADEVAAWYSNGYGSNGNTTESNLIGLWSLGESNGTTANDAKNVTGNGTLTNFPANPWTNRNRELLLTGIGSSLTGRAFVTYGPE